MQEYFDLKGQSQGAEVCSSMIERLSRVLYVPRLDLQQQQKTSKGKNLNTYFFFAPFEASVGITGML